MKVSDLIKALGHCRQDAEVYIPRPCNMDIAEAGSVVVLASNQERPEAVLLTVPPAKHISMSFTVEG